MSVPKKRRTSASRKRRASHHALSAKQVASCPNCGASVRPHFACSNCGQYKGRDTKAPITKPIAKAETKTTAEAKKPAA